MVRAAKATGWVLVVLGIPATVAAARWQELVLAHPRLAGALGLAWLAAAAAAGVARRALAKPAAERLDQLGNALNLAAGRRVSRYGRRWRAHVLTSLRLVEVKGLATVGPYTPELDEVFVDLVLVDRAPHQVSGGVVHDPHADPTRRRSIHELIDLAEPARLAVLGAPGSGKTTLLRHVACAAAQQSRRRRRLPVLITLRDHSADLAAQSPESLPALIRRSWPCPDVAEPPEWWERQLHGGRCMLLLDGLDEVAADTDRQTISDWIERQIDAYPGNDFVVTSRPHGFRTAPVMVADVLQVQPFTSKQVERFLSNWYLATERRSVGRDGPDVEARAAEGAGDLLKRLVSAPQLYELTVNPLLLTMIANVHRYRGALPGSRADLYGEICQVILARRQEAKRLDTGLPGSSKERVLANLAFQMMAGKVRDLEHAQVLRAFTKSLARTSQEVTADAFLADAVSNGIMVERERGLYAFAHHTFGEFLAAKHIREAGQHKVLVNAVDEVWWRETTLLYVAGSDADPIVAACLDSGTVAALTLAFDCLHSDAEIATDLRSRLHQIQKDAFHDEADPERRRLIAGVLASRHLRQFIATTTGARVCSQPITSDLYLLFLRDTGTLAPTSSDDVTADSERIVKGVWSADATTFVDWLNSVTASVGDTAYRLPTAVETHDLLTRLTPGSSRYTAVRDGIWIAGLETEPRSGPRWSSTSSQITGSQLMDTVTRDLAPHTQLRSVLGTFACFSMLAAALRSSGRRSTHAVSLVNDIAQDLGVDLDSVLAGTGVFDIALALALDRDASLYLAGDRVLDRTRPLDRALDCALDSAGAIARDLDLALAREVLLDLARLLASARAYTKLGRSRGSKLFDYRTVADVLELAQALDFVLDLVIAPPTARESALARERVYARARVYYADLDEARHRAVGKLVDRMAHVDRLSDVDFGVNVDHARYRAANTAHDLQHSLFRIRDLYRNRDPHLEQGLNLAESLIRKLADEFDLVLSLTLKFDLGQARAFDPAVASALKHRLHNEPILWHSDALGFALDRALIHALAWAYYQRRGKLVRPVYSPSGSPKACVAEQLATAWIADAMAGRRSTAGARPWTRIDSALVRNAGIDDSYRINVRLDDLATAARAGCQELAGGDTSRGSAIAPLIDVLINAADTHFTRRHPPAPTIAAEIRLAALTLATIAERGVSPSAHAFRAVAAGITLLERRFTGESPGESLVIARV